MILHYNQNTIIYPTSAFPTEFRVSFNNHTYILDRFSEFASIGNLSSKITDLFHCARKYLTSKSDIDIRVVSKENTIVGLFGNDNRMFNQYELYYDLVSILKKYHDRLKDFDEFTNKRVVQILKGYRYKVDENLISPKQFVDSIGEIFVNLIEELDEYLYTINIIKIAYPINSFEPRSGLTLELLVSDHTHMLDKERMSRFIVETADMIYKASWRIKTNLRVPKKGFIRNSHYFEFLISDIEERLGKIKVNYSSLTHDIEMSEDLFDSGIKQVLSQT